MFRKFIYRIIKFLIPIIIITIFIISKDPFKFIYSYEDYYENNLVTPNRELVCTRTFIKNYSEHQFNSFILGSSRSQAFKIKDWVNYLPDEASPFHFDALGEGLFGVYNKLKFLEKNEVKIENVLIVLDEDLLSKTGNRMGHLYISPPELSGESYIHYYSEVFKSMLDIKFIVGYLDLSIFGVYRDYMKSTFRKARYSHKGDKVNCDFFYGYDQFIKEDSAKFYNQRIVAGVFKRHIKNEAPFEMTVEEIRMLNGIKGILSRNKTSYKIIVSPLLDKKPLNKNRKLFLQKTFESANVYDFSGKNIYTESITNYYDQSHYRPKIARDILLKIHSN